jgi:hypothetical protein
MPYFEREFGVDPASQGLESAPLRELEGRQSRPTKTYKARKYAEPYQPTSLVEWNLSVIRGIA